MIKAHNGPSNSSTTDPSPDPCCTNGPRDNAMRCQRNGNAEINNSLCTSFFARMIRFTIPLQRKFWVYKAHMNSKKHRGSTSKLLRQTSKIQLQMQNQWLHRLFLLSYMVSPLNASGSFGFTASSTTLEEPTSLIVVSAPAIDQCRAREADLDTEGQARSSTTRFQRPVLVTSIRLLPQGRLLQRLGLTNTPKAFRDTLQTLFSATCRKLVKKSARALKLCCVLDCRLTHRIWKYVSEDVRR